MFDPQDNSQSTDSTGPKPLDGHRLQDLCDELEGQLRSGAKVRCENIFATHPWLSANVELALDLIYTEYVTRRDIGQYPSHDEYLARFSQWSEQLKHQFELDALLVDSPTLVDESDPSEPLPSGFTSRVNVRYRVIAALAKGGIGEIKRALDTEVNREVAVKSIQESHYLNPAVMARFVREAEITGRLEHPGIVPVYGMGVDANGIPFYAMRLIRGQNFQDAILAMHQRVSISGRFMSKEFLNLLRRFLSICETIAYAHSRGVIHRDIKPQNIMLGPFGEALVVDWGLAKQLESNDENQADCNSTEVNSEDTPPIDTRLGDAFIGTPAYMSPEQASGQSQCVGPCSDVYSLGATLYMLLTGSSRFEGSDIHSTLQNVVEGRFPKPREVISNIPRGLEDICLKALSKDSRDRYQSANDLASDIEHWLADEPITAAKESMFGFAARLERRNRAAFLAASVGLLIVSVVSIVAALRINQERLRADRQRIETQRQGARLAFDRGFSLINEHEVGTGMLWFEQALHLTPSDEVGLRRVVLTNMASASRETLVRKAMIPLEQTDTLKQFSTTGKQLLICSVSGRLTLIDAESSDVIWKQQLPGVKVIAAGFQTDDHPVLAYIEDDSVLLQNVDVRQADDPFGTKFKLPTGPVDRVVISRDEQWVATAGPANGIHQIRVWDMSTRECIWSDEVPSSVLEIEFLNDQSRIIVIEANGDATLFNFRSIPPTREKWLQGDPIRRIAVPSTGNKLLTDSPNGSILVWDLESKQRVNEFPRFPGAISSLACSSDGAIVAAAWDSGIARLWLVDQHRPACEVLRADRFLSQLTFRPFSRQLLVRQSKLHLSLFEVPDPDQFAPQIDKRRVSAIACSNDGSLIATASSGFVQIRNARSGAVIGKKIKHKSAVRYLAFLSDSSDLLTASQDGSVRKWNAQSGKLIGKPMLHLSPNNRLVAIASASFSSDRRRLATGDLDGAIRIWDIETCELIRTLTPTANSIFSLCTSSDGQYVVAGYGHTSNSLRLWNATTGELLWSTVGNKEAHTEPVRVVAFSPDNRLVISGSNDDTARFWNTETGEAVGSPMQHRGELFAAKFSPDGRLAVTAGYDATVRLWNVPDGSPYGSLMQQDALVLDVVFDPSGHRLLSGSRDKTARLWDVQTCLPLAKPMVHAGTVASVCYTMDSNSAITGRIWKLPTPLPDDPELISRWVRLATQRTLEDGNQIRWIDHATIVEESEQFHSSLANRGKPGADDQFSCSVNSTSSRTSMIGRTVENRYQSRPASPSKESTEASSNTVVPLIRNTLPFERTAKVGLGNPFKFAIREAYVLTEFHSARIC